MIQWTFDHATYLTYDHVTVIMPHDRLMSLFVDDVVKCMLPEWMRCLV